MIYIHCMKNKKLSRLAIVASGAMLLAGCNQDTAALTEYQKNAIQTKLEQMAPAEADAYIRDQMDGVQRYRTRVTPIIVPLPKGGVVSTVISTTVPDGLYLDYWEQHDTNGTLVDEYVDYAMKHRLIEKEVKDQAKAEFKAKQREEKFDQFIDKVQEKIDLINNMDYGF